VDHRADIYAFGCMAYELIAGRPPFEGTSTHKVLAAHMSQNPVPLGEVNPQAPQALVSLVMHCLEKDAGGRPQSAAEITRVLDSVTSGGDLATTSGARAAAPAMLRRALMTYAVAFVAVVLIAQVAISRLGLPDWVLPGAVGVMLLGLPVILFTAFVQRAAHRALTGTPTRTPGGGARAPGALATMAVKASPLMSWRRTTWGGVTAVAAFVLAVSGFMILRAMGIGPAGSLIASGKLGSRDALLIADFQTPPSDSALSRVLAEAMRTNLGESRVVTVVSPGAIAAGLERMRVPADTGLSAELARDLALREGIKAIVAGTVAPLSAGYVISVRLIVAQTGEPLVTAQATVDGAMNTTVAKR